MRRSLPLAAALAGLLCALLLGAAAAALAAPPAPADLVPPDAALAHVERMGGGRTLVVARLAPRRGLHALHSHLAAGGWRLRRVNALPEDEGQTYFRRSVGGYLLEVAIVTRAAGGGPVSITYWRCVRHLSCARG